MQGQIEVTGNSSDFHSFLSNLCKQQVGVGQWLSIQTELDLNLGSVITSCVDVDLRFQTAKCR